MDELQALLLEHALAPHERDFNLDLFHGPEADVRQVLAACASYPDDGAAAGRHRPRFRAAGGEPPAQGLRRGPEPLGRRAPALHREAEPLGPPLPRAQAARRRRRVQAALRPPDARVDRGPRPYARAEGGAGGGQMLAQAVGSDLRAAAVELEKLRAYAGTRTTLTEDDVLEAGGHLREYNVFELQKALGEGDRVRATGSSSASSPRPRTGRGEALRVVAMLTRYVQQLRRLAAIPGTPPARREQARHIGVPPFFLKEYQAALRTARAGRRAAGLRGPTGGGFRAEGGLHPGPPPRPPARPPAASSAPYPACHARLWAQMLNIPRSRSAERG
jgi:DNA polymerase III subunit delta